MELQGRVALITGAQQGIGRALAIGCAHAGASVAVNYLDAPDKAEVVCREVEAAGVTTLAVQGDVSDAAQVQRMVDQVRETMGRIDVLVNNAGVFPRARVVEMDEQMWDYVIDTNLKGPFLCCRAVAPQMIEQQWGRIINVSSTAAFMPGPRGAHYSASKAGLIAFTKALALELAPYRITANCLAPGTTDTAQPRYGMSEEELQTRGTQIPLGRIAQPEDMVAPVLFLAGETGAYITGQTFLVNGGSFMH